MSSPDSAGSDSGPGSGGGSGGSAGGASGSGSRTNAWQGKRLGKFRLLSLLGKGAMGKVFLAEDTTLHRQVALKIMTVREGPDRDEKKIQQFVREARAAARLNHPHIVNVLEIDEQKDMLYIAMDLVEGGDVKRLLDTGGALAPAKACDLAADAADALAFGHRLGVVHRDIKPSNLMLTRAGRCKVADFGLAELNDPNDSFKLPDGVIGTPKYMAPEVTQAQPATPASDQYSLGCTVWHMLTGRPVFEGPNFRDVLRMQIEDKPTPLAKLCPDLPVSLTDAVEKSIAKHPDDRHADLETFAKLLRTHSITLGPAGASASISSVVVEVPATKPNGIKRWWPVGVAGVSAVALGAAAVVVFSGNGNISSDPQADAPSDVVADATAGLVETAAGPKPTPPPAASTPAPVAEASPPFPTTMDGDLALPPVPPPDTAFSPPPTADAAPGEYTADQTAELKQLASDGGRATVVGTVARAYTSQSGKTFLVKFEGNARRDFQIIWKPAQFQAMADAFGGENGAGIAGKTIRVTGKLNQFFGTPQIEVDDPAQITILE
ncbi:MAG: serine/threonine-protein kinase [Planctomycetota bacterium]